MYGTKSTVRVLLRLKFSGETSGRTRSHTPCYPCNVWWILKDTCTPSLFVHSKSNTITEESVETAFNNYAKNNYILPNCWKNTSKADHVVAFFKITYPLIHRQWSGVTPLVVNFVFEDSFYSYFSNYKTRRVIMRRPKSRITSRSALFKKSSTTVA